MKKISTNTYRHGDLFPSRPAILAAVLLLVLVLFPVHPRMAGAEDTSPVTASGDAGAERLWNGAVAALVASDGKKAETLFLRFQETYPNSPRAEEALWRAIGIHKNAALLAKNPDWEYHHDLLKKFTTEYPNSTRLDESYFEMGYALYQTRFYREALARFTVFLKRFPDSSFAPRAALWKIFAFLKLGHPGEAEVAILEFNRFKDENLRMLAMAAHGEILILRGKAQAAIQKYEDFKSNHPGANLDHPVVIRMLGNAYFSLGEEDMGRRFGFHALNLENAGDIRADLLFEIGESYHREEKGEAAGRMYERVVEEGEPLSRAVLFSRFRLAERLDDPSRKLAKLQKPRDLADREGDRPYLDVLDAYPEDPMAQDVRYGIFKRYAARDDFDLALETGKGYLRRGKPGEKSGVGGGEILLYLMEGLIAQKRHQEAYDLYLLAHPHVMAYPHGRMLYLVGQALEALSLYKEASTVYYRALRLPFEEETKADLYFRRARVYLRLGDFTSADRLLSYLGDIYKDRSEAAEVYYLSGRLSEAKKDARSAVDYYTMATEIQDAAPERKAEYVNALLQTLHGLGDIETFDDKVRRSQEENWLHADALQDWFAKLGEEYYDRKEYRYALKLFLAALGENMPADGALAQKIHLRLGDTYRELGDGEKSNAFFAKAKSGPDSLLKGLAEERIKESEIGQMLMKLNIKEKPEGEKQAP